jgi:hypothetical protein
VSGGIRRPKHDDERLVYTTVLSPVGDLMLVGSDRGLAAVCYGKMIVSVAFDR